MPVGLCHSSCDTCSIKEDQTKCSSCTSANLLYATPLPASGAAGSCTVATNDKWVEFMTINKNTVIGASALTSVTYNGNVVASTSGAALNTVIYTQSTIEFISLTSNTITFQLSSIPTHYRLFARVRAFT